MGTPTHRKLFLLQKKIYRSLTREINSLLGPVPPSIRQYERMARRDFRDAPRKLTRRFRLKKEALIAAIRSSHVTWIGDFHPFAQSQRTALRLMREAVSLGGQNSNESWFLGLEMISSQHQKELDAYQSGQLSLQNFLEAIDYHKHWGFHWKHYAPLFEWARESQVRLVGLNLPLILNTNLRTQTTLSELQARDRWAAGVVTDLFKTPGIRGIVLYGDHHVASPHLPSQFKRIFRRFYKESARQTIVHQNCDSLYWKLAELEPRMDAEIVQLRPRVFCAFSSTPVARLQSWVNWIEDPDGDTDFLELTKRYGDAIADFLVVPRASFDSLTIRTLYRQRLCTHQRYYDAAAKIAYLAEPSSNGAAEIAANHLFLEHNRVGLHREGLQGSELFFELVMRNAFSFFGSLLLNPRRKCDLPHDHRRRLNELRKGKKSTFPQEKASRALVLDLLRSEKWDSVYQSQRRPTKVEQMAAQYLGQIAGKRFYLAFVSSAIDIVTARELFFPTEGAIGRTYEVRYTQLLKYVLFAPLSQSKMETL